MSEPYKFCKRNSPPAIPPHQRSILFESRALRGLTGPERMKAVKQLAHVLMLAAGIASQERDVER
jgi:hypothetical protein